MKKAQSTFVVMSIIALVAIGALVVSQPPVISGASMHQPQEYQVSGDVRLAQTESEFRSSVNSKLRTLEERVRELETQQTRCCPGAATEFPDIGGAISSTREKLQRQGQRCVSCALSCQTACKGGKDKTCMTSCARKNCPDCITE